MRRRMDDDGQLMMLAGIVLTISFILTALTLSQVSALEKVAAAQASSPIVAEWRFMHDRLETNLVTAIGPETTNDSVKDTIVPTIAATFRSLEAEKGYDFVLRRAGGGDYAGVGNEASLVSGGNYAAWASDGSVHYTHAADPDLDDGLVWQAPCPDPAGAASGCIVGVYLYVRLAEGSMSIEESILYALNQG